jgi:hypothetical protein
MKFLPSLKSAKSIALAAATIATAIATNMAPSQAAHPNGILTAPNRPAVAIFTSSGSVKAFALGCPELARLWSGVPNKSLSAANFDKTFSNKTLSLGHMFCGGHQNIRAYTSPAFAAMTGASSSVVGLLVIDRKPYFVESAEFFTAMGVRPSVLTKEGGESILKEYAPFGNPFASIRFSVRK